MNVITRLYLIAYNLGLTLGWSYILYTGLCERSELAKVYSKVAFALKIFQTAAVLEILHAAIGIVKSNVFLTFFQVFSRVFVLWGVLEISPSSQVSIGFSMLLLAWTITEIIRYGYYFLNLIGMAFLIQWFRYTLFIFLYPLGVSGELICAYNALDYVNARGIWTVRMPNYLNFTFNYSIFLVIIMLSYIPIFPQLYFHMFAQRRKILGGESKKKGQ